ncbi:MAG: hypothetical protein OEQ12_04735, partial [Nitrosopumilus sp.]|nr:hypothetical protein [Nitrosopumilus sp.]
DGPAFKSLSSVSITSKNMTVSFNDEIYEYVNALEPGTELIVDSAPPEMVCPEPLTLEADVVEGIHYDKSSKNNTDSIDEFVAFVSSNSKDSDNGNPNRGSDLYFDNNLPTILEVGDTLVSFNATDGIGNMASCSQIIMVKDTIAPEVVLPIGEIAFNTTAHDDVFVYNFKEEILNQATIFDRHVNWTDNTPGEKAIVYDNASKRRPICLPHPGTEFTVNAIPVGCEGLDKFLNTGFSHFNMTVTANSVVTIEETIASGLTSGDIITIRFSHETNKPPAQTKDEIDSLIDIDGKSLGASYSGYYQNPSTLVITIDDPLGNDLTFDGSTIFDIKDGAPLHSSSGILNSSSNPVPLIGSFEKSRSPFITDFIANDPQMDDIGSAENEEEQMVNMEYSPGDVLTIRFSDPTNRAGYGNEILDKVQIDNLFEFSPHEPGDDYVGSWINDRTFMLTIKERNTYTSNFPLVGTTTVKVIALNLKNIDKNSEPSNSESWHLQGSFGRFTTLKNVKPGFALATTQPSGIVTEIIFPDGGPLSSLSQIDGAIDVDVSSKLSSIVGNTLDIKSSDTCEDGCELQFTFTESDLQGTESGRIVIVHNDDEDRKIEGDEILETKIEKIGPDTFTAMAKIFSLSIVALAKLSGGGGGSGDSAPPDIQDFEFSGSSGGSGGFSASEIGFNNNLDPIIAKTGKPFTITLTIYENSGLQAFQHISLYMNLRGLDDQIHESDTYIRWDKGFPVSVRDPHGYFADAEIEIFEVGDKIQAVFEFNFALPMETSDVIIRTWDNKRNSWDSNFPGLLSVTGNPFYRGPLETIDLGDILGREAASSLGAGNVTSAFPEDFQENWSAFSTGTVTDSELLAQLGLEGDYIPDWFKETAAKWFMEERISEQEFVDALKYMASKNILFAI